MQDIYDIVKNVEGIYESDSGFQIFKDFKNQNCQIHNNCASNIDI